MRDDGLQGRLQGAEPGEGAYYVPAELGVTVGQGLAMSPPLLY